MLADRISVSTLLVITWLPCYIAYVADANFSSLATKLATPMTERPSDLKSPRVGTGIRSSPASCSTVAAHHVSASSW